MRVAYASRDLAVDCATGPGAQTIASAMAMARAGHEVCLVSAELPDAWQDRLAETDRLSWRPLLPERASHRYFAQQLSYADRIYDTVRALHEQAPLDVVDLPDAGGEALTLLRAKRLLAEFPRTCLAVSLQPWASVRPGAHHPASFADDVTAYAEQYARSHADLVLSAGAHDANTEAIRDGRLRHYVPGLVSLGPRPDGAGRDGNAVTTVVWLGPIRPGVGLGTLLRAVDLAREREPELLVILRGTDTPTDPFGRSYWHHLKSRLPDAMRSSVAFDGPLRAAELATFPPAGAQCVLASGASGTPGEALVAMAAGLVVIAPYGSLGAGLIMQGETGKIVPGGDPRALAETLVAGVRHPEIGLRLSDAALQMVRNRHCPRRVAERLAEVYGTAPVLTAHETRVHRDEPVSVVIPVYNHGRFLPAAVHSIRRGGPEEVDIVVVDDGSTDAHTVAVLDALSGMTVIRCPHGGLSSARNAGINRARGSLVLVLDADDLIAPGFLPAAIDALRRRDDLGFVGGYVRYFGLLDHVYVPAGPARDLNLVLHTHLKSMVLYRREALEQVGGYDENLPAFEDWEIQIRLAQAGYDSDVLPLVGQLYRRHSASMSFSVSNGMRSELVQYIVRKHAPALTKAELVAVIQNLVDLWKTGYEPSASVLLQRAWANAGPASVR